MHLASAYIHPMPHGGRCRVRIFEPSEACEWDSFVVILTELRDNPGMSVTNAAEEIAAAVVLANALPTRRTIFVEHYEDGARGAFSDPVTFDLLTFSANAPEPVLRAGVWKVELGEPSWKALDRSTVESLIGAALR